MTALENAIRDAEKGGWDRERARVSELDMRDGFEGMATSMLSTHKALLDPDFYRCLGKERGWYDEQEVQWMIPTGMSERDAVIQVEENLGVILKLSANRVVYLPYSNGKKTPRQNSHALLDHLWDGGTPESFFTSLT